MREVCSALCKIRAHPRLERDFEAVAKEVLSTHVFQNKVLTCVLSNKYTHASIRIECKMGSERGGFLYIGIRGAGLKNETIACI